MDVLLFVHPFAKHSENFAGLTATTQYNRTSVLSTVRRLLLFVLVYWYVLVPTGIYKIRARYGYTGTSYRITGSIEGSHKGIKVQVPVLVYVPAYGQVAQVIN